MKQVSKKSRSTATVVIIALMGLALFLGLALFSGCNSPSKKVDNAQDEVTEAQEDLMKAKEDFKAEVASFKKETTEKIIANEKIIAGFTSETAVAPKDKKSYLEKQVATFDQKNTELKTRMSNFKEDEKEKWQSFKTEFNYDMTELGTSLRDFTVNNEK
jgi:uncharacterized protein HemX